MSEFPDRIRLSARRLRYVTLAAIVLLELGIGFGIWVLLAGRRGDFPTLRIETGEIAAWPAAITLLVYGLLIGLALFRLVRMLGKVEAGAAFGVAGDLRGFALYLFLAVLATILVPPLADLLADGARPVALAIGTTQALTLLVTGLLFFVARLLDEAQRLADDHSQIV